MRRRQFITLLGGAASAWPLAARAQQVERVRRIGILMPYPKSDAESQPFGLSGKESARLGWSEGGNVPRLPVGRNSNDGMSWVEKNW
jgi:hypothetical protein